MQRLRISDFARSAGDSHANSALVGGLLVLTGIAVGMSLAQDGKTGKTFQGQIHQGDANPFPDPTSLLAGEILKLLK